MSYVITEPPELVQAIQKPAENRSESDNMLISEKIANISSFVRFLFVVMVIVV